MNHRTIENNHEHCSICDAFLSYFSGAGGSAVVGERTWRHLEVFGGHTEDKLPHTVGNGTYSLLNSTRKLHLIYQIKGLLLVLWAALLQIFKVSQFLSQSLLIFIIVV